MTFPSWGRGARAVAVLRDGRQVVLNGRRLALERVRSVRVISSRGGYTVEPLVRPRGATLRLLATAPQSSAPSAGPTLAVGFGRATTRAGFGARITVDPAAG